MNEALANNRRLIEQAPDSLKPSLEALYGLMTGPDDAKTTEELKARSDRRRDAVQQAIVTGHRDHIDPQYLPPENLTGEL